MPNELYISSSAAVQPYAIVRRKADMSAASMSGQAFVAFVNGSVTDYAIALTSAGGDVWAADFPSWALPGQYLVQFYDRSGASAAITDDKLRDLELYWSGSNALPISSPGGASGYYCTQADVAARFLDGNLQIFTNLGRDEAGADVSVLQAAIDTVDRQIDEALRSNGYVTPVAKTAAGFGRLTDIACVLVFTRLVRPHTYREASAGGTGNGRELYFAREEAKVELQKLIVSEPAFERLCGDLDCPIAVG